MHDSNFEFDIIYIYNIYTYVYMHIYIYIEIYMWRLFVNVDKTEVMIFHRRSRIEMLDNVVIRYGKEALRVVESFKYLGLVFHESGKYIEMIEYRISQGKRVLAAWRRRVKVWMLNGFAAERLFKTCVMPALEYGVCIWGSGNYDSMVWQKVERFWRYVARAILGVSSRAPNAAVLGELGWFAFKGRAALQALKLWTRGFKEGRENALIFRAMQVQREIMQGVYRPANQPKSRVGECSWLSSFKYVVCNSEFGKKVWEVWWNGYDMRGMWMRSVSDASGENETMQERSLYKELEIALYKELTKEWSEEVKGVKEGVMVYDDNDAVDNVEKNGGGPGVDVNVRELHMGNHNKMRMYALFKMDLKMEAYLRHVKDVRHRKLLTKLRIGVLSLRIESGRYEPRGADKKKGLPIQFRVCQCCDMMKVEDEIHFMMECPLYQSERNILQQSCRLQRGRKPFKAQHSAGMEDGTAALFSELMKCDNPIICRAIAKYIYSSFNRRCEALKKTHKQHLV